MPVPERPALAYLHGFASGPGSTKAQLVRARLAALGHALEIPDLAPDFTHATITSELSIVEQILSRRPAVLLGSSLGGYLATLTAARHPDRVPGLVLYAPAFGFVQRWEDSVGTAAMARWRAKGTTRVFHYGRNREERLAIDLLDDGRLHPAEPDVRCPTLIIAGRRDEAVPLASIEHFVARRPWCELVVMDAGHELGEVLDPLWERTLAFLQRLGAV